MATSQDALAWRRQFCKGQWKEQEGEDERRRDSIKEWTGMGFGDSLRAAEDREGWKGTVATSSVVPWWPPRLRDWDEMRWDEIAQIKVSNSPITNHTKNILPQRPPPFFKKINFLQINFLQKSHLPHFLGLFFIFLFFVNQFSLFFSAIL